MSRIENQDPFAAIRFRNYRLYTISLFLAVIAYRMQGVAIGWELYERTGSPLILGMVGLVQIIPVITLTLPAGHVADRFDRRQTVIVTQSLLFLCSVGFVLLSAFQSGVEGVFILLFLSGAARAFNFPASEALLPQLIPLQAFENAATWHSSAFQIASVIGPALGGGIIALQNHATAVYALDALLAIGSVIVIAQIPRQPPVPHREVPTLKTLVGGIHFVWQNSVILAAIALDLFAVLLGGAVALLPIFAKDILQVGPAGLGWLQAAPSLGAVVMALTLAYLPPLQNAGKTLLTAVVGFGVVTIIFGLSRSFGLSLIMLALSGAFDNISVVVRRTLVQVWTPDSLRGRVSAVSSLFISTSNQLGDFEAGLAAALFGPVIAVVSGGVGTIVVVLIVAWLSPELRQLGKLNKTA